MWLRLLVLLMLAAGPARAETTSAYTKLDLDGNCVFFSQYEQGASAVCRGFESYPVFFSEGDLRQSVRFGFAHPETDQWESFGQFNRVGTTIEWRLRDKVPHAAILRWYIEGIGDGSDEKEGQVLVVSTVATMDSRVSCVAGYVDARANKDANTLARTVADSVAPGFKCGEDSPAFHGKRGPYSGDPSRYFGDN